MAILVVTNGLALPLLPHEAKGGTNMADTNEDQPETLKELLKMQAETHKLVQQMAQDIRRVKNEMGLWDVTK